MPVTQKDIAKRLKLSQSLVAGVLSDRPGVWASEENRRRILQAAREMGYHPHAAARALRRGKTDVVACVFFGPAENQAVAETLADRLAEIGVDLLVKVVLQPEQRASRMENLLSSGMCDAVVLWGLEDDLEESALILEKAGIPFVTKGRFEAEHPGWWQADFDHEGMMRTAVIWLKEEGHRRIAFIGHDNLHRYSRLLLSGFRQAMRDAFGEPERETWIAETSEGWEASAEALRGWLSLPDGERPTAVVIGSGRSAWEGIERELAGRGRKIGAGPDDFRAVGLVGSNLPLFFGDGEAYRSVALAQVADAIGREMLPALLKGEDSPSRITRLLPPLEPLRSLHLPVSSFAQG